MSETLEKPVKKLYQLFAKLDGPVSYDNIAEDIQRLATPCSPVFELTDEEYAHYLRDVRTQWDNRHRIVCLSDNWISVEEIMQLIDQERSRRSAVEKSFAEQQAKMTAKKEAKRQAFAEQCSGANGKVKSSSTNTKAQQLPKVFPGSGFRGNR